ncbi:MAG: putative sulfate exporter family transporter [Negativicutes bacterium]|jgi:uncharacterized integral membrane protein (TIGR00698 family)
MKVGAKMTFEKFTIWFIIAALVSADLLKPPFAAYLPGIALLSGIAVASCWSSNQYLQLIKKQSSRVLSYAIVCLGFGFNLTSIMVAGYHAIGYTVISIVLTLAAGIGIGKLFGTDRILSILISVGTAICGGSAIAAVAPILRSRHEQTAVAMGVVFILNGIGLLLFPVIGHLLGFTQTQFGIFAALAIHDTSSVVGSCITYGPKALEVGTTIKLVRALWIIPVSLMVLSYVKLTTKGTAHGNTKKPWFILWFILASACVSLFPQIAQLGQYIKQLGEALFIAALFIIGCGVSLKTIKSIGPRPLLQAVLLWIIVSVCVIVSLKLGWLSGAL